MFKYREVGLVRPELCFIVLVPIPNVVTIDHLHGAARRDSAKSKLKAYSLMYVNRLI